MFSKYVETCVGVDVATGWPGGGGGDLKSARRGDCWSISGDTPTYDGAVYK